jgi:hypothetical protein
MTALLPAKLTERQVLDLLRERHNRPGNGGSGEYAFLPHVRDAAGFDAGRTFDAVTVCLWPSRGLTIDVYEVKISRSDWLRELAKPVKAESACAVGDRFWVVAPAGVVKLGELPPPWGLLEVTAGRPDGENPALVTGRRIRQVRAAELLHDEKTRTKPVSRDLLVSLLRAADGAVPRGEPDDGPVAAAYAKGRADAEQGWRQQRDQFAEQVEQLRRQVDSAAQAITEFEVAAGVKLSPGGLGRVFTPDQAAQVGRVLRAVLNGDELADRAQQRLHEAAEHLRREADRLDAAVRY